MGFELFYEVLWAEIFEYTKYSNFLKSATLQTQQKSENY